MIIYHYHPETRYFIGEGQADPSPLETDVWLIPAHATTVQPPEFPAGKIAVLQDDDTWDVIDLPRPDAEALPEPPALIQLGEQ